MNILLYDVTIETHIVMRFLENIEFNKNYIWIFGPIQNIQNNVIFCTLEKWKKSLILINKLFKPKYSIWKNLYEFIALVNIYIYIYI